MKTLRSHFATCAALVLGLCSFIVGNSAHAVFAVDDLGVVPATIISAVALELGGTMTAVLGLTVGVLLVGVLVLWLKRGVKGR